MNTVSAESVVVETSSVQVNGLKVAFRHAGDPTLPVMVLLHGFPSSSHMFRDLIPKLADRFHVIAPDLIGFGESAAPSTETFGYTFGNLATVTETFLTQLGVDRYYLYMHDYGGPIGFRLAAKHPERILGLVIQNANAYYEGHSQAFIDVFVPLWLQGDDAKAQQMLLPAMTKFQYTHGAHDPKSLDSAAWEHDQALLERPGSEARQMALFCDYMQNVNSYSAWQAYFRAHQPKTLVAWGRNDPFFLPEGAESYRRDLKSIEVQYFDGGHFALEEFAGDIALKIKQYF
jgi:pimeloyl-ACP methyl ester carboxylesterase